MRWRWACLAVTVVAFGGCSGGDDSATEELERLLEADLPDGAQVEIQPNGDYEVSVDGDEFERGEDLPRPDWLAPEIPLPTDLKIHIALTIEQFRVLRGRTDATAAEIEQLYTAAFADLGYTVEQAWTLDGPIAMKARDGDGEPISIEFTPEEFSLVLGRE